MKFILHLRMTDEEIAAMGEAGALWRKLIAAHEATPLARSKRCDATAILPGCIQARDSGTWNAALRRYVEGMTATGVRLLLDGKIPQPTDELATDGDDMVEP